MSAVRSSVLLCDAGPLVALIDRDDPSHAVCLEAARRLPAQPLLTTWPCFTEAMYLVGRVGGFPLQEKLWGLRRDGRIALHNLDGPGADRMASLMKQYRDAPMDLADASLVAAAEALGASRVFTLDSHFRAYRIKGTEAFEVIP
ncbi:MAG TPA: PIN domain-containing protein [Armatimonadota bacterium]